jgi:hypothetical protein
MLLALWTAGCGGSEDPDVVLTDPTPTADPTTIEFPAPTCDEPLESACGAAGSVVRGQVRVSSAIGRKRGDLFLALTHSVYNGPLGGGYHIHTLIEDVDLSEPVPFAVDMCAGGEMWSELNCEYGLVVILDTNDNQGVSNLLPDDNEPATRIDALELSCEADGPCLDVVLDCQGPDCVRFSDAPVCSCEAASCTNIAQLCG